MLGELTDEMLGELEEGADPNICPKAETSSKMHLWLRYGNDEKSRSWTQCVFCGEVREGSRFTKRGTLPARETRRPDK